jgi:hypothetical protein
MQGYLFSKPLPREIFEAKYLHASNAGAIVTNSRLGGEMARGRDDGLVIP